MKAVFIFTLLVTVCFTSNTSLIAQKILEEYGEVTAENKVLSHYFLYGTHEGKEILGHTKGDKIRVLENKNKVAHRKVAFKTKEGKALLNSVLLKRDEIVTLSLVISNKAEGIYLQTLNYDLTQKENLLKSAV